MPLTIPSGHFFRSLLMFAPPPQPQSSTLASGASSKKRSPHRATGLCPRFIMATMIFPPSPTGFLVFSKNDILSHLRFHTFRIGQREGCLQNSAFPHRPAVLPQEAQVFLARPLAVERKARQLHEKCPDLAGKRVSRMGKGGRDEHAVVLQHPADLGKGFLRLRHDVQRVGHDHHIEGLVRIGQAEHILHGKVQLCRAVIPLCLGDHLRRGVRRLDVRRRVHDVFCDQSRAGSQLQHRFVLSRPAGSAHTSRHTPPDPFA